MRHAAQGARHTLREPFAGLSLRLRGRTGLTQRDIASRLGVHVHSVQLWEAAASRPNARRLQALLDVFLEADAFTPGLELQEAESLWTAAMSESPRLNTPFDAAGFARRVEARQASRHPEPAIIPAAGQRHQSWGNAPDVERFLSRTDERATIRDWMLEERCRVVGVFGIGGIGKTQLATRVARDLESEFEHVYWRSLQNAPGFGEWLTGALSELSPRDPLLSAGDAQRFDRLLEVLRESRSLFIIDNVETVLQPGERSSAYLPGYATYGKFLQLIAETPHQSCVLLTSREEPPEIAPLNGSNGPVRALTLSGLGTDDVRGLLHDKDLLGDEAAWTDLVTRYAGNGLALKVVGETIRELFGGDITEFLTQVEDGRGGVIGGVRDLLDSQMGRLSHLERHVLRWMAVEREAVTFAELATEMGAVAGRGPVREATIALLRRSLLERRDPGPTFLLQPVIQEYVTELFTTQVCHGVAYGQGHELREQPLLKATATDPLRRSQERLILQPILDQLTLELGGQTAVERRLVDLLEELRTFAPEDQLYGPGNIINLLRLLRGDLRRFDLSRLLIRQAYLQGVEAQDANLSEAQLAESALPEAFHAMSVALSADGAHMITGTTTGDVCLRRASDRALLLSVQGHAGAVWRVGLGADERLLVSASEDGTARVWEASSGEPIATLEGHTDFVQGVALSQDNLVATASQDGTVKLWRATDGELLQTLHSPDGGVLSVDLSRDGALLVAGTRGGSIAFWDVTSGRLVDSLPAHAASVPGLVLSDDERLLASASLDGTAKIWDVREHRLRTELVGHTGGIWNVSLARRGGLAATAGQDGTVRLWSVDNGQLLTTLVGHHGSVWDVSLSADGARVASSGQDGTVRLSDARTGALLTTLQGHTSAFRDVALSADGRVLVSGSQDGAVTIWDTETGHSTMVFRAHSLNVSGVALSRDARVVASSSQDGTVKVWDVDARRLRCTLTGHTGTVWDVELSGDGHVAVSSSYDGTLKLWDTRRGVLLKTLHGHTQGVRGVALNDARGLIVSGSQDGSVMLWNTEDGRLRSTLRGHANSVQSVAIDDSGRVIASAGFDGAVKLWNADEGTCLRTLSAHSGGVLCVALSRDGRHLVTGGFDRTVKLWDTDRGQLLETLTGHAGPVWGLSLDAESRVLASGSFDGTIKLWDIPAGACQRTLQLDRPFERVNIGGLTGVTSANRAGLMALGAVDRAHAASLGDYAAKETLV